ncbi:hypothetical protein J7J63_03885 [Candidatus Bipolaricaulota bacterium]|nr:hypothetical protein [Candidatus Bipolaricaulota bacterium]
MNREKIEFAIINEIGSKRGELVENGEIGLKVELGSGVYFYPWTSIIWVKLLEDTK